MEQMPPSHANVRRLAGDALLVGSGARAPVYDWQESAALRRLDTNGDGYVSSAELREGRRAVRRLDTNGDGEVSREEWLDGITGDAQSRGALLAAASARLVSPSPRCSTAYPQALLAWRRGPWPCLKPVPPFDVTSSTEDARLVGVGGHAAQLAVGTREWDKLQTSMTEHDDMQARPHLRFPAS